MKVEPIFVLFFSIAFFVCGFPVCGDSGNGKDNGALPGYWRISDRNGVVVDEQSLVIVSPVEGVWANRQPLVLDVPEGYEVFYSFTGSDPMEFGFAYDGPVMLEAEGDVLLRLSVVAPDGGKTEDSISYRVERLQKDSDVQLDLNLSRPLVEYRHGDRILVPEGFSYRLGSSEYFLRGEQSLELSGGGFPERFIPCQLTDGVDSWRFVISPDGIPVEAGEMVVPARVRTDTKSVVFNERSMGKPPFEIHDWGLLTFTGEKLIYSLDGGYWQEAVGSVVLDRSVEHTIYWQTVDYSVGNPVYSMFLPPAPTSQLRYESNTAVAINLGEGFSLIPSGLDIPPLSTLCIDAFYGEEFETEFDIDVYYNGSFQGRRTVAVSIDKVPPLAPDILGSNSSFYNREAVSVSIACNGQDEVFYAVDFITDELSGSNGIFVEEYSAFEVVEEDFLPYQGGDIALEAPLKESRLYTVRAFSQDAFGNRSEVVSYQVAVDKVNFYVSAQPRAVDSPGDGSFERPFASMEEVMDISEGMDYIKIHIDGLLPLRESIVLPSNCQLIGRGSASGLQFYDGANIKINGGEVTVINCILEFQGGNGRDGLPFVRISDGRAFFMNCEVLGSLVTNGSLIAVHNADVSLLDCGLAIRSDGYGSLISGYGSTVHIDGGHFVVSAVTSVLFSLFSGQLSLTGAECKVFGSLGRIAELSDVRFSFVGNKFQGEFLGNSKALSTLVPLWQDGLCVAVENRENVVVGFPGSIN